MSVQWLVFTDLDGTLLDHHTYDFTPALPALEHLKMKAVPIIPVSSKTLAELEGYISTLGLDSPVVAENGTVIRLPGEKPLITAPPYLELRSYMQDLRQQFSYQFTGFGDMTALEVVESTGLSLDAAKLAMQRLASEPILWQDSEANLARFRSDVASKGIHMLQGGRFLHLLGDMDKGRAVQQIVAWYRRQGWDNITTLALGDSGNDIDMLLSVDIPVIIRKPDGTHLDLPMRKDVIISESPGPAGWNQAINALLNHYGE